MAAGDFNEVREGQPDFASLGAPRLADMRRELESGSLAPARAFDDAGAQLDYFSWELSSPRGLPTEVLRSWHQADASAVTAALVGQALVRDAWAIRTGVWAKNVDVNAWEPFFDAAQSAEAFLVEAVDAYPDSHLPWVPIITLGRALQADIDEKIGRFEQANERKVWDFYACAELLQGLAEKWTDDAGVSWGFAREVVNQTPPESPSRAVLAHVAIEAYGKPFEPKLKSDLYEELADIFTLFVAATGSTPGPEELQALASFVVAVQPKDKRMGQVVEESIGRLAGRCGGFPWDTGDDPLFVFDGTMNKRRREAAAILGRG